MSDLYAVRVTARPDDRTLELDIRVVHPDAMHIPVTPGFALMLLQDTVDGDAALGRELDLHTVMNPAWARANAQAFVESVELLSLANEPPPAAVRDHEHAYWRNAKAWLAGRLRVRATHPDWIAHVPNSWDSAAFSPVGEYLACAPALPDESYAVELVGELTADDAFLPAPKLMLASELGARCPETIWIPRHGARAYEAYERIRGIDVQLSDLEAWLGKPIVWHDGSEQQVGVLADYEVDQATLMVISSGSRMTAYRNPAGLSWMGAAVFRRGTPRLPPPLELERMLDYASPAARCLSVNGRDATILIHVLGRASEDTPHVETAADVLRLIALPAASDYGDFDEATSKLGCALRRDLQAEDLGHHSDLYPCVAHGYIESFELVPPRQAQRSLDLDELDSEARVRLFESHAWPTYSVRVVVTDPAWLEHLVDAGPWAVDHEELEPPEDWDREPRSWDPDLDVPEEEHDDDDDDDDDDDEPAAPKSTLRRRFELPHGARKGGEALAADDPRAFLRDHGLCEDLSHPLARDNFEAACKGGNVEAVKAYAVLGINLNSHADISGETPLIRAAEGDHVEVIRALARAGVDLEGRDGGGDTAVMTAVNWTHPLALHALLEVGASPDAPDNWENYPLVKALEEDNEELVSTLLDGGASANVGARTRDSALHWCLRNSNGERLRELLGRGGDANLTTAHERTLLHLAVAEREQELVEILLAAGADASRVDAWGWNPRDIAAALEADDLAELLEQRGAALTKADAITYFAAIESGSVKRLRAALDGGVDVETRDHLGRTGFLRAIAEQPKLARLLHERGADANALDADGDNALSHTSDDQLRMWLLDIGVAASLRDADGKLRQPGVEALLDSDSPALLDKLLDPRTNWPDLSDLSACHSSLIWGDFEDRLEQRAETLRRLSAAGADIHALEPRDRSSLLHGYIDRGHEPCALALIEVGDITLEDKNFLTPLHQSCGEYSNHDEQARITEALLEHGADYTTAEWLGRSPWDLAESVSNAGCIDALERRFEQTLRDAQRACDLPEHSEVDGDDARLFEALASRSNLETFMHWIRRRRHEIVRGLLRAGFDPNPPALDVHGLRPGKLPLTCAIEAGDIDMIEILLDGGADPNLMQSYGSTALAGAVHEARVDIVRRLLAAGAKPEPIDDSGHTPMSAAASRGNLELLDLLLSAGATVQPLPAGRLPLHAAVRAGQFEAAEWLLAHGADIDARNEGRVTALYTAIEQDEVELALALLAAGADPNVQTSDEERSTALICATKKGQLEVIEALLAAGADPHVQDAGGQSATEHAGYRDELRALFPEAGAAPIFMPLTRELPPLLRAVHLGDQQAFDEALAETDNVDATNYRGDTALMLAAGYRQQRMAEQLLDAGASVLTTNAKGDGPWTYAFVVGAEVLRQMFEVRGFQNSMDALNQMAAQSMRRDAAREAITAGDIARVAKLIDELEFDVDYLGPAQRPLELAIERRDGALIQLLLAKGADASLPDAYGVPLVERGREAGFASLFD